VLVGLVVGCHDLPFHRHPIKYGSVPFGFGTNAFVQINADVRERGHYVLFFVLQSASVPRDASGRFPMCLDTKIEVTVHTNGEPAIDTCVTNLYFTNSKEPTVSYSLWGFLAGARTRVTCQVRDLGGGELRATGVLKLVQQFPK
jgi:hypothetical protein